MDVAMCHVTVACYACVTRCHSRLSRCHTHLTWYHAGMTVLCRCDMMSRGSDGGSRAQSRSPSSLSHDRRSWSSSPDPVSHSPVLCDTVMLVVMLTITQWVFVSRAALAAPVTCM